MQKNNVMINFALYKEYKVNLRLVNQLTYLTILTD